MALGTTMAMAERPRPGWASYQNPNINNCQDMGNPFLLILGIIFFIKMGNILGTVVGFGGCVGGGGVGGRPGSTDLPVVTMSSYT